MRCPSGHRAPPLLTLSLPWSYHIISWLCGETNASLGKGSAKAEGWLAGWPAGWLAGGSGRASARRKGMIVHRVSEEQWRATTTTAAAAPPPRSCVEEPAPAPSEPRSTPKLPDRVLTATLKKSESNRDTARQSGTSAQKCPSGPVLPLSSRYLYLGRII